MYKFSDNNENNDISLHDCRAEKIIIGDKSLSFVFENGIYISAENMNNYNKKLSYTDKAEIVFDTIHKNIETDVIIYIFSKTEEENKSVREEISLAEFADMMNNGAELEFINSYKGDSAYLFDCWLWFKNEPYHKECEIIISAYELTYYWNELYIEE